MPIVRRCLPVLFLLSFIIPSKAQDRVYFDYNKATHSIESDWNAIEQLIPFEESKAVFVGETHTIGFEPVFKLALIEHLHEAFVFRGVFMEIGTSAAFLFNQYLETGDTSLITKPRLPYTDRSYMVFWQQLREYNQQNPVGKRIVIHGVDFKRSEVFKALQLLKTPGKEIPPSLRPTFELLVQSASDTSMSKIFEKPFKKRLDEIQTAFRQHWKELLEWYGSNAYIVEQIINNDSKITTSVEPRNKTMTARMQTELTHGSIDKFIGFFGGAHTPENDDRSLTSRCRLMPGFGRNVIHISSVYFNTMQKADRGVLPVVPSDNNDLYSSARQQFLKNDAFGACLLKMNDKLPGKLRRRANYMLFVDDHL